MNAPMTTSERPAMALEPELSSGELARLLQQPATFSTRDLLVDNTLDKVMRLAEVMASSRITCPKHLQGNVGDCAAVIGQAMRWRMDHNAVAQKTHLVNGALGYEAQLIIAVLNSSGLLVSRLDFKWADGWAGLGGKEDKSADHWCEVSATLRGERAPRVLRVSMAQVGNIRNSPNWQSDARQQLAYLAAKRWGRLHAPDVILGVYTPDEFQFGMSDALEDSAGVVQPPAAAAAARPSLPPYPADSFAANLPQWRGLVESGRKTAADLMAMLATKATFTDEQRAAVLALQPAPADTAQAASADAGAEEFVAAYESAEGA